MIGARLKSPEFRVDAAGISVLLALGAACWALNVTPFLQRHERTDLLREEGERARVSLDRAEQELRKIGAQASEVAAQARARPLVLEPVGQINQRMTRLSELARAPGVGLVITETSAGEAVRSPRYASVPIKIAGTGTYLGVRAWLERLASEQRDMGVKALRVTAMDKGQASFSVELLWYASAVNAGERAGNAGSAGTNLGSAGQ
jgi:Tfp pilus assembly protein PilO